MKRTISLLLCIALLSGGLTAFALPQGPDVPVKSAVLMEKETGRILYEKNPHEVLPPASVTKIMTLILIFEALDSGALKLEDTVTVSEKASKMGGSQIFLKENEQMSAGDLIKAIVVVSANDGCVAMAEHLAGSEENFVARMNEKAQTLGMTDTQFVNCNGLDLDGTETKTCAMDIAIMSRELLKHPKIKDYSTIWMDTLRDGQFQLSNTNKLIRFYKGATGLKTGSTGAAKYCVSATAERDGMELIAAVMAGDTSDDRFSAARSLLDFGFANFALFSPGEGDAPPPVKVILGKQAEVPCELGGGGKVLVEKGALQGLKRELDVVPDVAAPIEKGQTLGTLRVLSAAGELISEIPVVASKEVLKLGFGDVLVRFLQTLTMTNAG